MANPIHCDATDCPNLADVLVSRIASGPAETTAWCDPHYLEVCQAIADAIHQAEADQAAAEAQAHLEAAAIPPTASAATSGEATAAPGEPGQPDSEPPAPELTERPAETEAAAVGRSRRAEETEAGDQVPA
jgi:hypothetical protein